MKKTSTNESLAQKLSKQTSKDSTTRLSRNNTKERSLRQLNSKQNIKKSSDEVIPLNKEITEKIQSTNNENTELPFQTDTKLQDDEINPEIIIENTIKSDSLEQVEVLPELIHSNKNEYQSDSKLQQVDNHEITEHNDIDFDIEVNVKPQISHLPSDQTNNQPKTDLTDYYNHNFNHNNTNDNLYHYGPNIKKITSTKNNLTRDNSFNKINGMTHSQFVMQRDAQYVKQFDELNYLEQKLKIVEVDKQSYKKQYTTLDQEAENLKAKIHKIKYNKEINKLIKNPHKINDNLSFIKVLNDEKRKREEKLKNRIVKDKEKQTIEMKCLEEEEKKKRMQLMIQKRNKMIENIENIRKRGNERKKKVEASDRLVNDLLKSKSHSNMLNKENDVPLKVSNLYKF